MPSIPILFGGSAVVVSDDFARSDNLVTMGSATTGQAWTYSGGSVYGISGSQACFIMGVGYATVSALSNYFSLQMKITIQPSGANFARLIFRYSDDNNELFFGKNDATSYVLAKRVGGTVSALQTIPQTPANGDILSVEVRGSNIIAKINGVQVANVADSANIGGSRIGFRTADTTARFDDFICQTLA